VNTVPYKDYGQLLAHQKQYYKKNREVILSRQKQYYKENRSEILARLRQCYTPKETIFDPQVCACNDCNEVFSPRRSDHKFCCLECARRQWDVDHPEYMKQWDVGHPGHRTQWYRDNRERDLERSNQWWRDHPDARRAKYHKYRARKKGNGGSFTADEINALFEQQEGFCFYCGELLYASFDREIHIEHKIPISRGGSSNIENIALSCSKCNLTKGAKTHDEFSNGTF